MLVSTSAIIIQPAKGGCMAESEAQRRANLKYRKEKTKQLAMRFYPDDMDLWEHLESQDNKAAYIKRLIREDLERNC